ncbi:MAG: D-alanine--D-alanine ligase [Gammaproteobacteria bacterium]|nr:D-alanine--D-alanine ligase [Gammaproteobacteria bacterium]
MTTKLNLAVLFGGRSCEHEVSVISARSIMSAINPKRFHAWVVGIDKQGYWHLGQNIDEIADKMVFSSEERPKRKDQVTLDLHQHASLRALDQDFEVPHIDVIFPVLHGTFGEDGTIQGLFEMAGIPYVGCGVSASAIAMDKAHSKKLFDTAGIPQTPYRICEYFWFEHNQRDIVTQIEDLGYPVFVKPANLGSSVGISKVHDNDHLLGAFEHAFQFDNKVVVEKSVENCHEIECSVLGNHDIETSILGEIIPGAEFYNYETKYLDDQTDYAVPAPLDSNTAARVQELAVEAFRTIGGKGLARIDFFVDRNSGNILLNEVNTMPGFTPISMYPRLWADSGLPYAELVDRLIDLALENHASRQRLNFSLEI